MLKLQINSDNLDIVDDQGLTLQTLWYGNGGAWYENETGNSLTLTDIFNQSLGGIETASITVNGVLYALSPVGRVE
jgi:hypothetical protein